MNTDSSEERLADLIEVLLNWVEFTNPKAFFYGAVKFRGAIERFFYFAALGNAQNLFPLLASTARWRSEATDARLIAVYDQYFSLINKTTFFSKAKFACRTAKKILQLIALSIVGKKIEYPFPDCLNNTNANNLLIGFFAINARFVNFFSGLLHHLDKEKAVFFSDDPKEIAAQVKMIGASLTVGAPVRLHWKDVHLSFASPLFPTYAIALLLYLRIQGALVSTRPAVLIFAEGTSMGDELAAQAARNLVIPTIRLQSGRAGVLHSGYRGMSFDRMLCWGEGFVERYKRYSPHPNYVVTGNPSLNWEKSDDRGDVVSVFTQPISTHISTEEYQLLADVVIGLIEQMPKVRVLIRKHPIDNSTIFDSLAENFPDHIQMLGYFDASLNEVFRRSTIAIGFFSTTLSEAAASEVVPVILKIRDQHSVFPFPERYGAAILADSVENAVCLIIHLFDDAETLASMQVNMRVFGEKFFGPRDGGAMSRVVSNIRELACR